jgi:UDP-N-acetylglucosamine pyrophosphorylase
MVEYTDLKPEQMEQRNTDGSLMLKDANSGSLIINVDFLSNYDFSKLPAHFANGKSVTIWNPATKTFEQSKATKLEYFAFDIFMDTVKSCGIRITEEEFAPIKDSTEDAVKLYKQHKIVH